MNPETNLSQKTLRKRKRKKLRNPDIQTDYSFIKILTGSDLSIRKLPLMSIKSVNPGPVIWLTACVHGDEVGGMIVIQEIFKKLKKKQLLKGMIYALPLMNPIGFENASRHIPLSEEDLNRSFPGNKNGSLAERMAEKIFSTIEQTKPSLVLDLHNDWRKTICYAVVDSNPGAAHKEAYEKTKNFVKKTLFVVVHEIHEIEKSLTYSLLKQDIPAFTLELGESYVVNEKNIELGVKAVWNILASLGMVEQEESFDYQIGEDMKNKTLNYSDEPVSHTSGIIRFLVNPGDIVKKGHPIAKIYNAFGKLLETLNAENDGIILGLSDSSVAFPGVPVMSLGIVG